MWRGVRGFLLIAAVVGLYSLAANAEHAGGFSGLGRPIDSGVSQQNLGNLVSACAVGRPGASGVGAVDPLLNSNAALGGVVSGGGAPIVGASTPNGQIFAAKCLVCHGMKPADASIAQINAGLMPPPPGSPRSKPGVNITLSPEEKAAIITFLQTGR